ncbi:MAG: class I SAM-dependent methyltransferase [Candidatus Micrarchaeota archaeon]|nr:class I SAM-dependent methyltransferase [Candidatus Micrarchaeota archaeon]
MQSPIYWRGEIYRAAMHAMHWRNLGRRYDYVRRLVMPGDRVLDVGCGTGTLQSHLNGNYYLGLELNEQFISYARNKKRNVIKQDAMTFDRYGEFDVCVAMDLLHHLNPKHEEFMKKAVSGTRKRVIVCEPYVVSGRHPIVEKMIRILDNDGLNDSGEWENREELIRFFRKFNPARLDELDNSVMAVYERGEK